MENRQQVEVVIGGKVLAMSGGGDEEYIQKVAACVNGMIRSLERTEAYQSLPPDLKPILIELNIADELMQSRETARQLESDLQLKENEMAALKQELVEAQMKLERPEGKKRR